MAPREDIRFPSDSAELAGWFYPPADDTTAPAPCVVMAHGFSAVKEQALPRYAQVLAEAGMAVLVHDHPGFGASGGEPRQQVDPDAQLAGYRAALDVAAARPGVDPERLGVWGSSFSGGHAITLAATDDRVRAAVAQVPFVRPPGEEVPAELLALVDGPDGPSLTLPVVTEEADGGGLLSPDPEAYAWFTGRQDDAPAWRNEVTLASLVNLLRYRPIDACASVHAPVLVIAARDDVLCPIEATRQAVAAMPGDCELVEVATGHFGIYDEYFDLSAQAAAGWFSRWFGLNPS